MTFGMTQDFKKRRLNDREYFYCPSGHPQHYTGKSEAQKLKDQLSEKQRLLEAETGRAHMLQHQRDEVSRTYDKMRTRVKNGVCPCCDRTFQNLLEHMKTKHPDYADNKILKSLRLTYGLSQSALGAEIGVNPTYISLFENEKKLPEWDKDRINEWISENAA